MPDDSGVFLPKGRWKTPFPISSSTRTGAGSDRDLGRGARGGRLRGVLPVTRRPPFLQGKNPVPRQKMEDRDLPLRALIRKIPVLRTT